MASLLVLLALGLLALLAFALIGLVTVIRWLVAARGPGRGLLTRREKLEAAAELLGERLPEELKQELWASVALPPVAPMPSAAEAPPSRVPTAPAPAAAPTGVAPRASDEVDVSAALDVAVPLPLDDVPLAADPELRPFIGRAHPGLRPFLTFENVLFALATLLILAGTVYFAAVTFGRLPERWHYRFLVATTVFYGVLLVAGAHGLERLLRLTLPAQILAGISGAVAAVAAVIAGGSFAEHFVGGVLATLAAAGLALAAALALVRAAGAPALAASFSGSVALLAVASAASKAGLHPLAGTVVLAASLLSLAGFTRGPRSGGLRLGLAAVVPCAGVLLSVSDALPVANLAASVAALGWLGVELWVLGHRWAPGAAVVAGALAMLLALPEEGAVAATAVVATLTIGRVSWRLGREGDAQIPSALTTAGFAALLFTVASLTWAPGVASVLSDDARQWFRDLVTRPGESVAASWDALAALPFVLLAFATARQLTRTGDPRARVAEWTGYAGVGLGILVTLATVERQPWPSAVELWLEAGVCYGWAALQRSTVRVTLAHVATLFAAGATGYALDPAAVPVALAIATLLLLSVPRPTTRSVGGGLLPFFVAAALIDARFEAPLLAALLGAHGVLVLVQPLGTRVRRLEPLGPLTLIAALLTLTCYAGPSGSSWIDPANLGGVLAAGLVIPALLAGTWRAPRYLLAEAMAGAALLAVFSLIAALSHDAGSSGAGRHATFAVAALALGLFAARGGSAPVVHLTSFWAAVALPLAVALGSPLVLGWPGAAAALLAGAALAVHARRSTAAPRAAAVAAVFAHGEGLLALLWSASAIATRFETGRGVAPLLPVLGSLCFAYAALVGGFGGRATAAPPGLIRVLHAGALGLGLVLLLVGLLEIEPPTLGDQGIAIVSLVVLAVVSWLASSREARGWPLYVTDAALLGIYAYVRVRTPWLDRLDGYDAVALAAATFALSGASRWLRRRRDQLGAREHERVAALLPLLLPLVVEWQGELGDSIGLFLGSLSYALLARETRRMRYGWLAGLLADLALVPLLARAGIADSLTFALPVGLTLLAVSRLYAEQLAGHAPLLRSLALLILFGATSLETFAFDSIRPALLLAVLSIAGVLLGVVWRLRSHLYLGFGFLVLDLAANLTNWGLADRALAGVLGVGTGMLFFAFGVLVTRYKELLVERYRLVEQWEW